MQLGTKHNLFPFSIKKSAVMVMPTELWLTPNTATFFQTLCVLLHSPLAHGSFCYHSNNASAVPSLVPSSCLNSAEEIAADSKNAAALYLYVPSLGPDPQSQKLRLVSILLKTMERCYSHVQSLFTKHSHSSLNLVLHDNVAHAIFTASMNDDARIPFTKDNFVGALMI